MTVLREADYYRPHVCKVREEQVRLALGVNEVIFPAEDRDGMHGSWDKHSRRMCLSRLYSVVRGGYAEREQRCVPE